MKPSFQLVLLVLGCVTTQLTGWAQTNWYTPEVARQLQRASSPDKPATPPPFQAQKFELKNCRIEAAVVAYFDTIASYAQGRVVDGRTYRPIRGARVEVISSCPGYPGSCTVQTTVTDSAGFFRLGWVGCGGPEPGSNRPLQVRAAGYPVVATRQVSLGGLAYLHIELRPRHR